MRVEAGAWVVGVGGGSLVVMWRGYSPVPGAETAWWPSLVVGNFEQGQSAAVTWSAYGLRPRYFRLAGSNGFVTVPLWMFFVAFAVMAGALWWSHLRRPGAGACKHCGYDLTGNVSGRCPECGVGVERPPGAVMGEGAETRE
ncbi:MAG: hypothetical protein AMXMBFR47_44060 [Planctomycetota bacterium]